MKKKFLLLICIKGVEKEEGKFYVNSTLNDESFVTIQYLFYINKYEYHNDDYSSLQ